MSGTTYTVGLSPDVPGTITADADNLARWVTTIRSTGGDSIEWRVQDANDVAYTDWFLATGTLAGRQLTISFRKTGDYLVIRQPGNDGMLRSSWRVTVKPYVPPAVAYSIALSSGNPGALPAAPDGSAEWTTTVTTTLGDSVEWAVFTTQGFARHAWAFQSGTLTGASIRARFFASGDYVVLRQPGNDALRLVTSAVTIALPRTLLSGRAVAQSSAIANLGSRSVGPSIKLVPFAPGTLQETGPGLGAVWNVQVEVNQIVRIGWAVVKSSDFSWRDQARFVDVPASGLVALAPRFMATGDFLKVFDAADLNRVVNSPLVTIATASTVPGGTSRSLSMTPRQPGVVYEPSAGAGAAYTFTVSTSGIARIGWVVVRSSDLGWRTSATFVDTAGSVQVTARIVATGDFVKIWDASDAAYSIDSGIATVALDPNSGATVDPADVAFVKAWVKPISMGADIERRWAWAIPGGIPAAAVYLRSKGFDYVRLFYAYRPAYDMLGDGRLPPTKAQFARILDAAAAWIAQGFKVLLDCCDVLTSWEDFADFEADIYQHIRNCAAWIAERNFDRNLIAFGPVNEWGGDSDYTLHQVAFHKIMRDALPGYVLICGPNNWKHYSRLLNRKPYVMDGRTLWDHHSYDAKSASEWAAIEGQLATWSVTHGGLVTIWSEAGLGYSGWYDENGVYQLGQERDISAWMANLANMFPAMASQRPGFWAITYGESFRLNKDAETATIKDGSDGGPNLELAIFELGSVIKEKLGTGTGSGPGPAPDPGGEPLPPPPDFSIPLPPELYGLFDGVDPFDALNQITVRNAVIATQLNFQIVAAFFASLADALTEALAELIALDTFARTRIAALEAQLAAQQAANAAQADVNAAQDAELASLRTALTAARLSALPGPIADADVPLQVIVGDHYVDSTGLVRRRLT